MKGLGTMNEDKLTSAQRLRLEALNQANQLAVIGRITGDMDTVLQYAHGFENYIRTGKVTEDKDGR